MKRIFINYYLLIFFLIFFIYNNVLIDLKIGGLIYQVFMIVITILNVLMLVKYKKEIKFKSICLIAYFCTCLISKNIFQFIFVLSNIITLIVIGYIGEGIFIKIVSTLCIIILCILSPILIFVVSLIYGTGLNEEIGLSDIYEDTHYYCDNNYEAYEFSAGAMDRTHYSVGKHYEIINIKGLYVRYSKRNETTYGEYLNTIEKYNGRLVGEIK